MSVLQTIFLAKAEQVFISFVWQSVKFGRRFVWLQNDRSTKRKLQFCFFSRYLYWLHARCAYIGLFWIAHFSYVCLFVCLIGPVWNIFGSVHSAVHTTTTTQCIQFWQSVVHCCFMHVKNWRRFNWSAFDITYKQTWTFKWERESGKERETNIERRQFKAVFSIRSVTKLRILWIEGNFLKLISINLL